MCAPIQITLPPPLPPTILLLTGFILLESSTGHNQQFLSRNWTLTLSSHCISALQDYASELLRQQFIVRAASHKQQVRICRQKPAVWTTDSSWLADNLLNVCVVVHTQSLVGAASEHTHTQTSLTYPLLSPLQTVKDTAQQLL